MLCTDFTLPVLEILGHIVKKQESDTYLHNQYIGTSIITDLVAMLAFTYD